jgi:hypothetical protein
MAETSVKEEKDNLSITISKVGRRVLLLWVPAKTWADVSGAYMHSLAFKAGAAVLFAMLLAYTAHPLYRLLPSPAEQKNMVRNMRREGALQDFLVICLAFGAYVLLAELLFKH